MECKIIGADERHGYRYETWMTDDEFFVTVKRDDDEVFRTEHHANRGRVERSAEEWIAAEVARQEKAPSVETAAVIVGGWRLIPMGPDKRGDFSVDVSDIETGEPGPLEFRGYINADQAMTEAQEWAGLNARRAEESVGDEPVSTTNTESEFRELALKGELAPMTKPDPMLDGPARASQADEAMQLLQRRRELKRQRRQLETAATAAKSKLKACDDELAEVEVQLDAVLEDDTRQVALPLVSAPRVAVASQKVADRLVPGEAFSVVSPWVFLGVEHVIVVREGPHGRWTAHLQGRVNETEGFGATRGEAIDACKARASIFFADAEPGAVEPGPRKPPKRKKLRGKTSQQVEAALREAMTLDEAAKTIGCSVDELTGYAGEIGMALSTLLGRDAGQDEKPRRCGKRGAK